MCKELTPTGGKPASIIELLISASVWSISLALSILLTASTNITEEDMINDSIIMIIINIVHTLPIILLAIIYSKIFRAAHTSSERARRNSAVR